MNEERLWGIVADMSESIEQTKKCRQILAIKDESDESIFIAYGLKQIFVSFFITVEDFTSIMLKELKKFKVGIDMKQGLEILLQCSIISDQDYEFLNEARLIRNRISHRYKEPTKEELIKFIANNESKMDNVLKSVKKVI